MSKTVQRLETKESIDERTQRVLRGIIEGYITSNEPVGSRSLSKTLEMGLSPATIRNIMSDLSDMGFLMQLHTSAGRIPTDKAYRFYVDQVVVANQLTRKLQKRIQEATQEGGMNQVEDLLISTDEADREVHDLVTLLGDRDATTCGEVDHPAVAELEAGDRKSTRLNSSH